MGDHLVFLYLLFCRLDGRTYFIFIFIPKVLSELFQPVAIHIQVCMWFQHDATEHQSISAWMYRPLQTLNSQVNRLVGAITYHGRHAHSIDSIWIFSCEDICSISYTKAPSSTTWTYLPELLLLLVMSERYQMCLKKCAARYITSAKPALLQF